jgi:uncharacterized membrane protein YraQ (UPF0718 family)
MLLESEHIIKEEADVLSRLVTQLLEGGLRMDLTTQFGGALHFFIYDTIKIFLLLAAMVFAIGVIRTWMPEHRLKKWMSKGGMWGNFVAALFGAITPFCSCSSIPIFISLLKAGVPLGVTFSFLITSPIINEYLVILMASEFGVPVTIAYVGSGLLIGTVTGAILGKMNLLKHLEADIIESAHTNNGIIKHTFKTRIRYGIDEAISVIKQIWLWVFVGIAIGAFIHNYVPQDTIHSLMEATGIFSVPIATVLGVPMYGSCAAIVPVAVVLFQKGIPLGTALAFMMAMAALSLPEAIMLRRTMKLQLIGIYFGITTLAIIFTGYLLNTLAKFL